MCRRFSSRLNKCRRKFLDKICVVVAQPNDGLSVVEGVGREPQIEQFGWAGNYAPKPVMRGS